MGLLAYFCFLWEVILGLQLQSLEHIINLQNYTSRIAYSRHAPFYLQPAMSTLRTWMI